MPNADQLILYRLKNARSEASLWLASLSGDSLPERSLALVDLAHLLCRTDIRLHTMTQGTGLKNVLLPPPARLIRLSRRSVIRIMTQVFTAGEVTWPNASHAESAAILGALACSYAHEADLIIVALILRAAARLHVRDELLNFACLFLLDQQRANGAFGLGLQSHGAHPDLSCVSAQLRILVDIVSAVDAYADVLQKPVQDCAKEFPLPSPTERRIPQPAVVV